MGKILVALIRAYQRLLSPWLGDHCRFSPSCSEYAVQAIQKHGSILGVGYAVWRVLRCQPFCAGGLDPVP